MPESDVIKRMDMSQDAIRYAEWRSKKLLNRVESDLQDIMGEGVLETREVFRKARDRAWFREFGEAWGRNA